MAVVAVVVVVVVIVLVLVVVVVVVVLVVLVVVVVIVVVVVRTGHCGSAQIAAFPVQRSNSIWRNRTKLNSIPLCCSLAECTMS